MKALCLLLSLAAVCLGAIRYEAEDAHYIGATNKGDMGVFSGSGFVTFLSELNEYDGAIIFSVNIAQDAHLPLTLRYANAMEHSELSVRINGIEQSSSLLIASSNWANQTEKILFRQGLNTVVLRAVKKVSSPLSLDYIEIEGAIPMVTNGATLPYFEIEAENAATNGQSIGPSRDLYQLPTEASGRKAIQISGSQYVEFTLTGSANAITVRFSIPDTSDGVGQEGALNVLVDGTSVATMVVTSHWSWAYGDYPFTKRPGDGKAHHFYDEARTLFSKTYPAGSKVRLVATGSITYTIDLADFYTVPAPYNMPSGFLSVADYGADATGKKDSTAAFTSALTAAASQSKGLWIPQGYFLVTTRFTVNRITIRGAGPWYSTVRGTVNHGVGFFGNFAPNPSVDVQLYDFAMVGDTNVRDDNAPDSGVGGAFNGNSIVQNVWIEHTKCGMWLDGPFSGFHVTGTIIRNTYADGVNFHLGISNSMVEQSILRNVGDDGLAVWAEKTQDVKNTFRFNTIQVPVLANGIALYGGQDCSVTDNYVADTICDGGGLQVGNRYNAIPVAGTTTLARNTLVRCGAPSRFGPQDCGSIWIWQSEGAFSGPVLLTDITCIDSSFAAITFWDGTYNTVKISNVNVQGGPYVMEVNSASGTVPVDHVVATGLTLNNGGVHSCAGLMWQDMGGNSGWTLDHNKQHCN